MKRKSSPDWEERSYKLLMDKITEHGETLEKVHETLGEVRVAVGKLQVRATIWGALAGTVGAAVAVLLGRNP